MSQRSYFALVTQRPRTSYNTLEKMLNRTTLSVQRLTHSNIIVQGQTALSKTTVEEVVDKELAVEKALAIAETRFAKEMKAAKNDLRQSIMEEHKIALRKRKEYYDRYVAAVIQKLKAKEEKHIANLTKKALEEKNLAVKLAIEQTIEQYQTELNHAVENAKQEVLRKAALEKDEAVMNALKKSEEEHLLCQKAAVSCAVEIAEKVASQRLASVKDKYDKQIKQLEERLHRAHLQFQQALVYNREIENDFLELQNDYKRFLEYTGGQFHSDYLIQLRSHELKVHTDDFFQPDFNLNLLNKD